MDLLVLVGIASALLVVCLTLYFLQRKNENAESKQQQPRRAVPVRAPEGVPRRAQIARNQRNRVRQNAAAAVANEPDIDAEDSDDGSEGPAPSGAVLDEKMGSKKRAKLEAKEQKRLLREQELKQREERKLREAQLDEERKKLADREAEEERNKEEKERLEREEREKKEHEEYLKMKEAFTVEAEGFDENDESEKENLLLEFVQYIKDNKVVVLEDLANHFKLKTQQVIDRIHELQANDTLTGVIDDRGKFIYVSEEELQLVAKFIKQRGRVSIAELAESSNNLINLTPVVGS